MAKNIIGLVVALVIGGLLYFSYKVGAMATSFDVNMCYSEVFVVIKKKVDAAAETQSNQDFEEIKIYLEELPFHGYETNCEKVLEVANRL